MPQLFRLCTLACLLLCAATLANAQDVYHGCPMAGTAQGAPHKARNRDKNRYNAPTASDVDASITVAKIVAPGDDHTRFQTTQAATLTGWVANVMPGGHNETCNCGNGNVKYRDTHIELAPSQLDSAKNRRIIVEVTPRLRAALLKQGVDWSTANLAAKLMHQRVRITGWLFFDDDHADLSQNTAAPQAQQADIWRATAWEIHPITNIEVWKGNKWVTVDKL